MKRMVACLLALALTFALVALGGCVRWGGGEGDTQGDGSGGSNQIPGILAAIAGLATWAAGVVLVLLPFAIIAANKFGLGPAVNGLIGPLVAACFVTIGIAYGLAALGAYLWVAGLVAMVAGALFGVLYVRRNYRKIDEKLGGILPGGVE